MSTVTEIILAERETTRAINAVRGYVEDGQTRRALSEAERILAEVRHFATCWDDNRNGEDTAAARDAIINRLVTALVPSRL